MKPKYVRDDNAVTYLTAVHTDEDLKRTINEYRKQHPELAEIIDLINGHKDVLWRNGSRGQLVRNICIFFEDKEKQK